jgi:hypothetical protein
MSPCAHAVRPAASELGQPRVIRAAFISCLERVVKRKFGVVHVPTRTDVKPRDSMHLRWLWMISLEDEVPDESTGAELMCRLGAENNRGADAVCVEKATARRQASARGRSESIRRCATRMSSTDGDLARGSGVDTRGEQQAAWRLQCLGRPRASRTARVRSGGECAQSDGRFARTKQPTPPPRTTPRTAKPPKGVYPGEVASAGCAWDVRFARLGRIVAIREGYPGSG